MVEVFDPTAKRTGPQRLFGAPAGRAIQFYGVPTCITCWLDLDDWRRRRLREIIRCLGCGRPMRPWFRYGSQRGAKGRREWLTCCAACFAKVEREHDRERRRVHHRPTVCSVCEQEFTPTRSDQVTCSNRCRQKLHRQRHASAVE